MFAILLAVLLSGAEELPTATLIVGTGSIQTKVGETIGLGWGAKVFEWGGSHYSATGCKDPSQNAFITPYVINSTGGSFLLPIGPELAGCNIFIRYYVFNGKKGADSTVTIVVAP